MLIIRNKLYVIKKDICLGGNLDKEYEAWNWGEFKQSTA